MRVEFHITPEIIGSCLAEKKDNEYKGTAGRPIPPVDFFPPAQIES